MASSSSTMVAGPVLLFDGECGLCNRVVRLMLRLDGAGKLRYAPLQSEVAQGYLRAQGLPTEDFDSLVFVPEWARPERGNFKLRTDGAIAALRVIGGFGSVLAWVRIIPHAWRDGAYRLIARWRYRIFGVWRPQPLARVEWAGRFLA